MLPNEAFVAPIPQIAVGGLSGRMALAANEIQARAGEPLTDWQFRIAMALSYH